MNARVDLVKRFVVLAALTMLTACASSSSSTSPKTGYSGADAGHYKVGQPYQVGGNWYTPSEDYSYDETGVASWYGKEFHGGQTANGEEFNKNELTAAHKTLPLPTLARVTNLDNGRSIVVRINDRGPFSGARIIDVSQRSAQLLGFENIGTAKVRVQVLADESKAIADAMRHYGGKPVIAPIESAQAIPPQEETQTAIPEQEVAAAGHRPTSILAMPEAPPVEATEKLGSIEVKTLEPIRTTPAIHRELVRTQPVQEVVQLPVTGTRQLYIQAGAFSVMENATRLKDTLGAYGPVSVSDVVVNGQTMHRVRVGPIADVTQADQLLAKMKKAGISNPRTVVD